jgi:hypothetical protein
MNIVLLKEYGSYFFKKGTHLLETYNSMHILMHCVYVFLFQ